MGRLLTLTALLGLAVLTALSAPGPPPVAAQTADEPMASLWALRMPSVVWLAVAPHGERIVTVSLPGSVRCFDRRGRVVWRGLAPGADRAEVAREGRLTAVYSRRRPTRTRVRFYDGRGRQLGEVDAGAPIENVAVAAEGDRFVIAAGGRAILGRLADGVLTSRAIAVDAPLVYALLAPDGAAYVATRRPPSVRRYNQDGEEAWRVVAGVTGPAISTTWDGKLIAMATDTPRNGGEVWVALFTADGERVWQQYFPGRAARVRLAAASGAVMVTWEKRSSYLDQARFDPRLAYLNQQGVSVWAKGGVFTAPLCAGLQENGAWVVALDAQQRGETRLRLYNALGQRQWIHELDAPLLIATSSGDGRTVAGYDTNATVTVVAVQDR